MGISIRNAAMTDAVVIASNNSLMAEETEGRTLSPDIIGRGVAALLADPGKGRYWVAEAAGQIVGQLMVTYEWSDWRNGTLWWIQSVYIAPDFRRQGVFSALYHHVESLAAAEPDVCGLRLYVEDNNHRAQRTYEALGMVKPSYVVMESVFEKRDND
jgi:ribosomal protein S18 acetylase RimI-like enzyme